MNSELKVYAKKASVTGVALIWTGLIFFMAYNLHDELFKWSQFNPNGINTLIFLLFSLIGVFWWIKVFDSRLQILITKEGIRIRKNTFPFSSLRFINWNEIQFFYLFKETKRSITGYYLVIRKKESDKDFKVELNELDKSIETILIFMRKYASEYKFIDLSKEFT